MGEGGKETGAEGLKMHSAWSSDGERSFSPPGGNGLIGQMPWCVE